jgi:hypothetical protein
LLSSNHKSTQTCLHHCFRLNQILESKSRVPAAQKKKEARHASPLVVHVEATPTLRFPPLLCSVIFFLTRGSFCKILACNLIKILYLFTILLLYMCFEHPGHTNRGFCFIFLELGCDIYLPAFARA